MNNLDIYNACREVPETAKSKIPGGRLKGKTDINPMWRIKTLTEQFGPCGIGWYYKTEKQWMETYGEEVAAFVNISLYIKADGEWSQPIPGSGGSLFAEKERGGIHVSDECYKMATTDAISVACKQLGIGADVYWESDTTKYTDRQRTDQPTVQNRKPSGGPERQTNPREATGNTGNTDRQHPRDSPQETAEDPNHTNHPAPQDNPREIPEERKKRLAEVKAQLARTGYTGKSLCATYKINSLYDMTDLQIKDFLKKIKSVPDRGAG